MARKMLHMDIAHERIQRHSKNGFVNLCHLGLTELPPLPSHITSLWCDGNQLTHLPSLPPGLTQLRCDQNQLSCLPLLPHRLHILRCDKNSLVSLPPLPESLRVLWCHQNCLTTLPVLPTQLTDLSCAENRLIPPLYKESPHHYEGRLREHESKMRIHSRVKQYKEELMMNRWHPSRVERLLNAGLDIEDM